MGDSCRCPLEDRKGGLVMVDPVVLNSRYIKIYQADQAVMVHSAEQDPDLLGALLARRRSCFRYQDRRFAELADL